MQEEFLQILRTLKQNVYIMTSGVKGDRCAVTVSSVTSLSLEPPLIIVCINKNASMHENLEKNKKFCLPTKLLAVSCFSELKLFLKIEKQSTIANRKWPTD